jgi:hypothetical protein
MDVTVHIPEELARRLTAAGADLPRLALEALAFEEFRAERLTAAELASVLDLQIDALNEFLEAHGHPRIVGDQVDRHLAREAAQAIRAMSRGVALGGLKIKDLINEGRKRVLCSTPLWR